MKNNNKTICLTLLLGLLFHYGNAQVLETEESKPLQPGQFEIGTGLEFQTSSEGTETALPLAIEYGLTNKFTILVEPVGFTSIMPKEGLYAKGIGDLEITLFYQVIPEKKVAPAISLGFEIKIPTATNPMIGTGEIDYTPIFIMSKTTGKFFTSVNLSYTILGKPEGVDVSNLFNYAIGTIFTASTKSILFAEIYGNTSALGGTETPEGGDGSNSNVNTQELSGGENVIAFGYGYYLNPNLLFSLGISYDNNNAIMYRPGIDWKFGGKKSN